MRLVCVFSVAMLVSSVAGCGSGAGEPEAASSQSDVFDQLKAIEANVTLDAEGMIVGVGFENASQGDDAVALLTGIPTLKMVELAGSGVTDDGLAHLEGISTLESVNLEDTGVSRAAVEKLREALPNCRIAYGDGDDE